MTVSNQTRSVQHTGNGATTEWPFAFGATAETLGVQVYDSVAETLTDISALNYSVDFTDNTPGVFSTGTVTYPLVGSPLSSTKKIIITRTVPMTQSTALGNQSSFYPAVVELALDRITMLVQQVADRAGRSLAVREGEAALTPLIFEPAERAGKALMFSDDGLALDTGPTATEIAGAGEAAQAALAALAAVQALAAQVAEDQEDIETLLESGMADFISFTPSGPLTAIVVQQAIDQLRALHDAFAETPGNGIRVRTSSRAYAARSIAGTTNQIAVTNGNGVSGNPTLALVLPSQAEAQAGADANKPMPALRVHEAIAAVLAARKYESTEQTISNGELRTLTHGLGTNKLRIEYQLVCVSDDLGYSTGDVIKVDSNAGNTAGNKYNTATITSTEIQVRYANAGSCFVIGNKGDGSAGVITNANWRLRVLAWV